jgi:copper chaperone CopZ
MKKLIMICLLMWAVPSMAQIKSATLVASGLTCSMCSKAIFKALEAVPTVKAVDVDIEKSSYTVSFKEGAAVQPDDLKTAVENAGFFVASLQVTATFPATEVKNDTHTDLGGLTIHFVDVKQQTLNGDQTITLIDKGYVPVKNHKKYSKKTTMKCYETGVMASCCPNFKGTPKRIYHVTI